MLHAASMLTLFEFLHGRKSQTIGEGFLWQMYEGMEQERRPP